MGFPSPAADFAEQRISLDAQLISRPAATYFMRAANSHFREGVLQGGVTCSRFFIVAMRWVATGMRDRRGVQD